MNTSKCEIYDPARNNTGMYIIRRRVCIPLKEKIELPSFFFPQMLFDILRIFLAFFFFFPRSRLGRESDCYVHSTYRNTQSLSPIRYIPQRFRLERERKGRRNSEKGHKKPTRYKTRRGNFCLWATIWHGTQPRSERQSRITCGHHLFHAHVSACMDLKGHILYNSWDSKTLLPYAHARFVIF